MKVIKFTHCTVLVPGASTNGSIKPNAKFLNNSFLSLIGNLQVKGL